MRELRIRLLRVKSLMFRIGILLFFVVQLGFAGDLPLKFGPRHNVEIVAKKDGISQVKITGPSAHFWSQPVTSGPKRTVLAFEYFSTTGINSLSVRFRDADESMAFVGSAPVPLSETWQPFSIELSEVPTTETRFHFSLQSKLNAGLLIRNLTIREPTTEEIAKRENLAKITAARQSDGDAFLKYLRTEYAAEITSIDVSAGKIQITGKSSQPIQLVEIPPQLPSHLKSPREPIPIETPADFTIELPRIDSVGKRDRASSRWRLESPTGEIVSHAKWPSQIEPVESAKTLPKLTSPSQKGIGGVPSINSPDHPIFELGVSHATINVVLNGAISEKKKPGLKPHVFEGKTYFINPRFLSIKNNTLRQLNDQGIIVTCILLVGNQPDSLMRHPAAESRGTYAMPNLATPEGTHLYRAAIDLITRRFSKPETRVANWVIHNEIDQAGTWTNMGDQPLARYLETYARSTRITYHTARHYDPHARVFVSLTHHWTQQSSGTGTYVVRDIVDLFSEIATAEGAFDWGVAYHPYPRGLRNPDTWNDTDVSYDFDTKYITPKNVAVLPAYLGPERPILFSEQGFNTPTLSQADQKRQVAGLIYMFRKLRHMPTVEAYHLHRYQDMPDREGGLRLGVMDENGNRKLGWHAYAAIGTDAEKEHEKIADEILPPTEPLKVIPFHDPTGSVR